MTMTTTQVFGRIVTAEQVEQAVIETLQLWLPTYLRQMEVVGERPDQSLRPPRHYKTANRFENWPDDQLPVAVVVSPGLREAPRRLGSGEFNAKWTVGIGIVCSADNAQNTNSLAKAYAAAVRAVLTQKPDLGGFAAGVEWLDETYDDAPVEAGRTLASGQVVFAIQVNSVLDTFRGPVTPTVTPEANPPGWSTPPNRYTIDTVEVTVDKEEL